MKITSDSYFKFSGGEVHCKIQEIPHQPIVLNDYTMDGLMALAQHVQVWRKLMFPAKLSLEVVIPYLPYARQDRWMALGEPFSLKIYCDILNSLQLDRVTIWDAHSDVAPALINNCMVIPQWEFAAGALPKELFDDHNVIFVSPDAGAYKKISKLMTNDYRIAIGTKERGEDGKILKTGIYTPVDLAGKTCVIVDDICDGGRTFIELGKTLKRKGAKKIVLYVTHGIFSQGLEELSKYIDEIYTTNSFRKQTGQPRPDYVTYKEIA